MKSFRRWCKVSLQAAIHHVDEGQGAHMVGCLQQVPSPTTDRSTSSSCSARSGESTSSSSGVLCARRSGRANAHGPSSLASPRMRCRRSRRTPSCTSSDRTRRMRKKLRSKTDRRSGSLLETAKIPSSNARDSAQRRVSTSMPPGRKHRA
eukprot:3029184-Rhodomonas_salina.3